MEQSNYGLENIGRVIFWKMQIMVFMKGQVPMFL